MIDLEQDSPTIEEVKTRLEELDAEIESSRKTLSEFGITPVIPYKDNMYAEFTAEEFEGYGDHAQKVADLGNLEAEWRRLDSLRALEEGEFGL